MHVNGVQGYYNVYMQERADEGEFQGLWMSHETDEPLRDAFPNGWGGCGEDALG